MKHQEDPLTEMRITIGKRLGWTSICVFYTGVIEALPPGAAPALDAQPTNYRTLPDFCQTMDGAWEIIKHCVASDMAPELNLMLQEVLGFDKDYFDITEVTPMVICQAFLKIP